MDFVPIVFTASGGMGEHRHRHGDFQRQYWNPHWIIYLDSRSGRRGGLGDENLTVGRQEEEGILESQIRGHCGLAEPCKLRL
jgi:hypothetical protein